MFRIDSDGATESIPTPEADGDVSGYFQGGNPSIGQKATQVSADWLNTVQEELLNVIEDAGIDPDKTERDQLLKAIRNYARPNLGITFGSGVLKITQADGSDLSAEESAPITLPSVTAGLEVPFKITASQTLNDSTNGAPQILGRFGTTASVAWASAMPIFIGIVNKDDTAANLRFFLTRDPTKTVTPASTNNIGIGGTAPSSSDYGNIVLFGTAANTNYNSKPCQIIGSIQGTIDNSAGGSMAIGALVAGRDGIGRFQKGQKFTFPLGQNGAGSGKYFVSTGPTWATPANIAFTYSIELDGCVDWEIDTTAAGNCTNGSLAGDVVMYLPYAALKTGQPFGGKGLVTVGGVEKVCHPYKIYSGGSTYIQLTDATVVDGNHFSNAADDVVLAGRYKAY